MAAGDLAPRQVEDVAKQPANRGPEHMQDIERRHQPRRFACESIGADPRFPRGDSAEWWPVG